MRTALLCLLVAPLTGCATFGQKPRPVGEPGPVACIGAASAIMSWEELDRYMRSILEAQHAYSCGPLAPPVPVPPVVSPEAPAVPALR